jgi:hypothetical protein
MRPSLLKTALLMAVTAAGLLLPAAAASANSYSYKLSAAVDGAQGYVWFDFESGRYGGNYTPTVTDNRCDNHPVYVSFYTDGGLFQKFQNSQGCSHTQSWGWRQFSYKPNQTVTTMNYVYIKVCVADHFGDTCQTSGRTYNPYH